LLFCFIKSSRTLNICSPFVNPPNELLRSVEIVSQTDKTPTPHNLRQIVVNVHHLNTLAQSFVSCTSFGAITNFNHSLTQLATDADTPPSTKIRLQYQDRSYLNLLSHSLISPTSLKLQSCALTWTVIDFNLDKLARTGGLSPVLILCTKYAYKISNIVPGSDIPDDFNRPIKSTYQRFRV
jgi:hypothetical protein